MKVVFHETLRRLLREHADGLTVRQLCANTGFNKMTVGRVLETMPDVYVDRYASACAGTRGQPFSAVYCAVHVPEDCPKPDPKINAAPAQSLGLAAGQFQPRRTHIPTALLL